MNKPRNFAQLGLLSWVKKLNKPSNIGKLSKFSKLSLLNDKYPLKWYCPASTWKYLYSNSGLCLKFQEQILVDAALEQGRE